jgi:hypothetical protein
MKQLSHVFRRIRLGLCTGVLAFMIGPLGVQPITASCGNPSGGPGYYTSCVTDYTLCGEVDVCQIMICLCDNPPSGMYTSVCIDQTYACTPGFANCWLNVC